MCKKHWTRRHGSMGRKHKLVHHLHPDNFLLCVSIGPTEGLVRSLTQSNGNQRVPLCSGLSLSSRLLKCVVYDPWRHSAASAATIIYWDRGQKIRTFGIIRTKDCDVGDRIPSNGWFFSFPFLFFPFARKCIVLLRKWLISVTHTYWA